MRGRDRKKSSRPFKAGLNPGVAIALAGGGVLLASAMQRQWRAMPPMPQMITSSPTLPQVVTSVPQQQWIDPEGHSMLAQMPRPLFETVCPSNFEHVVQDIPAEGRVLVINDVMQPWSDDFRSAYDAALSVMSEGGATLLTSENAVASDEVDLLARARLVMGKSTVDASTTGEILRSWMQNNPGAADAIVWITPPGAHSAAPGRAYIFPGPTMYSGHSDLYVVIRMALMGR
jgi:hypothetical protein